MNSVDFSNLLTGSSDRYSVSRALSDQFIRLNLRGPLVSPALGSYSLRTRFAGQYYQVRASSGNTSDYANPRLTAFGLETGLFSSRRYPLRLYYGWSDLTVLNYEQENRAVEDQASPELAAVRRYDSSNEFFGGDWRIGISPTSDFVTQLESQNSTSLRQYDFDEQRSIFVSFLTPSPDPTLPVVRIIVENSIPEGEVTLLVDGIRITTLVPDERFEFDLESGPHDVEFVPTNFNRFFQVVDVNGDMLWQAFFNEPPGRRDIRRSETAGRAEHTLGRGRRLQNNARLNFSDSFEDVAGRDALLVNLENDLGFRWTPQTQVRSTTTYTLTSSVMQAASDQDVNSLRQQTSIGYQSTRGGRAGVEHLFDRSLTTTGPIEIATTQNRLRLGAGRPWGPFQHYLTLNNITTHLSNSEDYRTLENRSEVRDDFTFYTKNLLWRPRSSVLFTTTNRKNPDSAFQEFEIREFVEATRPTVWKLGEFLGTGDFGWRRRTDSGRIDGTLRLGWSLRLARQFGPNYRLSVSALSNQERYSTQVTEEGAVAPDPREPQRQQTYRVALRANPFPAIGITASYARANQVDRRQRDILLALTVRVPKLNVPVTTTFSDQTREITGNDDQATTRWETKFSFGFRSLRIQFEHAYIAETLFTEDYKLNTFRAEITRAFTLMGG